MLDTLCGDSFGYILAKSSTCLYLLLKFSYMQRVTGLGGFFIKSKDPRTLCAWYEKHLGVPFGNNTYVNYVWKNENNPSVPGSTVFSFFP